MFNVGLTGNVAAGKSVVAGWFAEWGATVIDADQLVREAERPGTPVLAAIAAQFGTHVITAAGDLDRPQLRRLILADQAARERLNAIVHPAVRDARNELARRAAGRGDCMLINDIPLLFETLDPAMFDAVILVDASEDARRRRLEQRGIHETEIDALLAAQLPAAAKRARSDFVIENDGTLEDLRRAAWSVWVALRARAARHMAGGDSARGKSLVAVVPHAGDEAFLIGGTLARLAEAGVHAAVWLVETGGDEPPPALRQAAAALGVRGLRRFAAARNAVVDVLAAALRRAAPHVVLTVGGEPGPTDEHHVLATAARTACAKSGVAAVWSDLPDNEPGAHAAVDVRPWLDVKRQAVAAYPTPPCGRAARGVAMREYFRDTATSGLRADLFGA
jgi:dephospho-CoA kinase